MNVLSTGHDRNEVTVLDLGRKFEKDLIDVDRWIRGNQTRYIVGEKQQVRVRACPLSLV